ncbi:M14 family zinc carboxypeptidase [Streptomyces sp. JJ66]|uniref:M14 family zinc carboxypeptidase n=1 Tax=Streptomyces sp. JJ66 TaxID=2803843 RepID=UPI0027E3916A|nr:M14 family zinc carboxypeptidase [Streptomyces sp. JJ66]
MHHRRILWAAAVAAALTAVTAGSGASASDTARAADPANSDDHAYVYRVHGGADVALSKFSSFDLLETREGDDLFVLGDADTGQELKAAGLRPTVEEKLTPAPWEPPKRSGQAPRMTDALAEETYYGGYRTVNAQYAHLDQVARDHAGLATVVDFGDSWRKSTGRAGGYDLKAICLTKKTSGSCQLTPNSSKPRFLLQAQVHARELSTGEMAYRWIDYLTDGYGSDTKATELLDTREIWVVPIGNPDGVDMVQQGFSGGPSGQQWHRKNANHTHGSNCSENSGSGIGIDLNRNNSSHWGGAGTSSNPCSQVYKGPAADSEHETKALHSLYRKLFPDTRGTGDRTPADPDTQGFFVTLHSYSNMVLFPWGWNSGVEAGNDADLRRMGKDMAELAGGWQYGQPGEILYNASGTHDDWVYDDLGVPSYTFEIGPNSGSCGGFHPSYSCQNRFWNQVKPMLVYSAENAKDPYGGTDPGPGPGCSASNGTDLAIRDHATVNSPATVSGCGREASTTSTVKVQIQHTYIGDLTVQLIAPDGSAYTLHNRSGGSTDNINQTYTVNLSSEAADGTWNLRVTDSATWDTGTLTGWELTL